VALPDEARVSRSSKIWAVREAGGNSRKEEDALIFRWAISVEAALIVLCTAPLFLDLALCLIGNLRRPIRPRAAVKRAIRLAVVVPAHDEEESIGTAVASIQSADSRIPIWVVAHNCGDATAAVAAKTGACVLELDDLNARGKGAALRHGFHAALQAGANAVMVVDADSTVSVNLIAATRAALEEGAEATQCRYELEFAASPNAGPLDHLRATAFLGMNVLRARGRAGLGLSTGISGNGFALTAATLERVPFLADSIVEDVEYHTRLACAGVRVAWIGEAFVHAGLAGQGSAGGSAQAAQEARWEGGRLGVALHRARPLLSTILHGNMHALETLASLWSLPLSRGIATLLLCAILPVDWLHGYAVACAATALLYVLGSALLGTEPLRDLGSLAAAPLYMAWKAVITPLVLRTSRSKAAWIRTHREASQP
jgi:hypothetical protein